MADEKFKLVAVAEKVKETKNAIRYETESDAFGPGSCIYTRKPESGEAPDRIEVTIKEA